MGKYLGLTDEEKRIRKNESAKRYRAKNKELLAVKKREWRVKNADWVREKQREYNVSYRHRTSVINRDRWERGLYKTGSHS